MGKIGGKTKTVRVHAELKYVYNIDLTNGDPVLTANTLFPSGKYTALNFTPSWTGHRFVGWFKEYSAPSASIPSMSGVITKDTSVVYSVKTIYAHWQLPVTVVFDASSNGGEMPDGWNTPYYYAGQPYGVLPKPTHESLNFTGWYDSNGNRITTDSIVPDGGARMEARYSASSFSVRLNDEWEIDESVNPDSYIYDGVYRSFSNTGYEDYENYSESMAKMYIDVVGYTHFRIYIASNSESNYDYVVAMKPDVDPEYPPYASWGDIPEDAMASTSEYTYADPSRINDYIPVDYELDGGAHRICIVYRKDSSYNDGEDCGYVLIPKEQ
jgi:hypothetical protein